MERNKNDIDLEVLVMKLIGKIEPAGDTSIDDERFDNVKDLIDLVDKLLVNLSEIEYRYRKDQLISRVNISNYINQWLRDTHEWMSETLEED